MNKKLSQLSNAIRFLSIDAVQKANSGHPGMPMGMADVATILFKYHLRFNPKNPSWINRDRFVLSAGHGSMLLYSLLYLTGYQKINLEDISYINAHGTSTPAGDQVEAIAIDEIFKNRKNAINVSSTKSQIGHLLGAAGAVEAIYSIKSINDGILPFTKNLDHPISTSKINFIRNEPIEANVKNVLSNSFGFGGTNVSLIFSAFDE